MSSTWLSTKYFDFAQKRDKAFTLYKQTNNLFHKVTFIKLRKICNIISKQDKTKYYETKVFQNQQNPKKMWNLLNSFRNIPNKEINNIEKIENLGIVTNKKDISNYFNDCFISIIEQLYGSINNNLSTNNFYLKNNISIEKFKFTALTQDEVSKIIKGCKFSSYSNSNNSIPWVIFNKLILELIPIVTYYII